MDSPSHSHPPVTENCHSFHPEATALPTPPHFYLCVHASVCHSVTLLCVCLYISEITCPIWPCVLTNHVLSWVTHLLYFSVLTSWYQHLTFVQQDYLMLCSKASLALVYTFWIWTTHLSEVCWWEYVPCILMIQWFLGWSLTFLKSLTRH